MTWFDSVRVAVVTLAVAAGQPGTVRAEPRPAAELKGHDAPIWSIAFSPDGKTVAGLAGAFHLARLHVWDVRTGNPVYSTAVRSSNLFGCVAFRPDGQAIVVASGKCISVWKADQAEQELLLQDGENDSITVAFSPDGKQLVVGGGDFDVGVLRTYDAATGKRIRTLDGPTKLVGGAAFTPDGKHVIAAANDRSVRLWEAATGKTVWTRTEHGFGAECLALSADGKKAATGDLGRTICVWDVPGGKQTAVLKGHPGILHSVAFNESGTLLAAATGELADHGEVWLWDVKTAKPIVVLRDQPLPVRSVAFSPDGKTLASVCGWEPIQLWDVPGLLTEAKR